MTGVPELASFQAAAVEHIVGRLRLESGSRRFLLADEVGLGKTHVARGVITTLARRRRDDPLRVVYICSNAEIAEQNRVKLVDDRGRSIGRLTELALTQPRPVGDVALYALTPGTSLREGTGLAWERRLLLYCVHRVCDAPVWTGRWRAFFQCSAGPDRWHEGTKESNLRFEFERKTTSGFQAALGAAWSRESFEDEPLPAALRRLVDEFDPQIPAARSRRNVLVGRLRGVMQRVALNVLEPELVVLDEIQRFREVIDKACDPKNIAHELFSKGVPVLILSATPYRLLTLDHEVGGSGESHHAEFFATLRFLFGSDTATPDRIEERFREFGERLRRVGAAEPKDARLLELKREIEKDLLKVVCRTERNLYLLDQKKGVDEPNRDAVVLPDQTEIAEYFRLSRGLGGKIEGSARIAEYWKSAPSPLTFLDASYRLHRRLQRRGERVPRSLLTPKAKIHELAGQNHRMRSVVRQALGEDEKKPPRLWTKPSYTYYKDEFFGDEPPRKLLVFSGWRFVPKAIAIVASRTAAHRLGPESAHRRQPLKFSDRPSFHVFNACFPSRALANAADPLRSRGGKAPHIATARDVFEDAVSRVGAALDAAGIEVTAHRGDPAWRVAVRLDSACGFRGPLRSAIERWQSSDGPDEASAPIERHRKIIVDWIDDGKSPLSISRADLRRLAFVAAFSPAVSLLRALESVHGEAAVPDEYPGLFNLCLGPLRRYLNRPTTQQVIRSHVPTALGPEARRRGELGYAERVLRYAADAHMQAVLDEFAYLQRHAGPCGTLAAAIEQFESIWTLARGSPRTNGRGPGTRVRIRPEHEIHATHFALAFGDDVSRDQGPGGGDAPVRKSAVREAFNSPFWPFVLATTSVGQEGLDFHLYCRDVFHWNLPSNPVDLEQREGRINRRDGLAVRASISRRWPLSDPRVAVGLDRPRVNPWSAVFDAIAVDEGGERYKHGLSPHWIYECDPPEGIRRHVPVFATSRDQAKYERLKTGLALYRLVFGQANQEDLLEQLREKLGKDDETRRRVLRRLAGYMLNLSPIGGDYAERRSLAAADEMLRCGDSDRQLRRLLEHVAALRGEHASELGCVASDLDGLVGQIERALSTGELGAKKLRLAVSALEYLRNPYDRIFDLAVDYGFDDDIEVIRKASTEIRSPA